MKIMNIIYFKLPPFLEYHSCDRLRR